MVYDLVALTIFNDKTYIAEQSYINNVVAASNQVTLLNKSSSLQ